MARKIILKNELEKEIYKNFLGSKKIKNFLDLDVKSENTRNSYKISLLKYFLYLKIKNPDNYLKNPKFMSRKKENEYLIKIEDDVKRWSK